ncbi:MAG: DNA helicase UvrD [Deltaproteobacteria bacterium]|nr:DNA helicase UvrD [Deltaproteobacteria bacterium]MBM4338784.1 DNA helicase UvrD [Deltaproteobacteria bacterium]
MRFIADFHLHSKYSRATSKDMEVETLARWAKKKGILLLGTGDFTHPTFFAELQSKLIPSGNGLFQLRKGDEGVRFILATEVSNIYSQGGKGRRIHNLIFAPSFEVVVKINTKLSSLGKLSSDGRPIFGFTAKELVKMILDISGDCLIIPAHAWTPWFSIFGANSGFDSIEECFGEMSPHIYAIETGLSSDPEMNWRLSALDRITLISNSDAHSPNRLGREANGFDCELNYQDVVDVLRKKDSRKFLFTIEFFPEEGKYHYDGHRQCGVIFSPEETKAHQYLCPGCQKKLTVGVMHRVSELSDRQEGFIPRHAIPSIHLIPLEEVIAEGLGVKVGTKAVDAEYDRLIERGGSEFHILLDATPDELASFVPPRILEGIIRMRQGKVSIVPGHDGVYGKINLFPEEKEESESKGQMRLF